jgi:Zn-finger nucleic acid-binding protein
VTNATPLACSNCGAAMEHHGFPRHVHGDVEIDVCWSCHVIWFDQYESAQLSPAAVIALFRLIHEHREQAPRALAGTLICPRCSATLALTHDMQRSNRLRYHRCPDGHGRLISFMQFLREKSFVRSLSAPEIESLKASVSQVRCSSCGAVIDLARDTACSYCRAPLAILDAEAVNKALAALTEADRAKVSPTTTTVAAAFESILASHRMSHRLPGESPWTKDVSSPASAIVDLVVAGIGQLFLR